MKTTMRIKHTDQQVQVVDATDLFADYLMACNGDADAAHSCLEDDLNEGLGKGERATWAEVTIHVSTN